MARGDSPWRALWRLVRPHRGRYFVLSLTLLAATAPSVAIPLVIRSVVDRVVTSPGSAGGTGPSSADGVETITALGLALLALAVGGQLLRVMAAWLATTTAWNTANDLRARLARHVFRLDHDFHRTNTPGALIQRIDGDVTSISDFLAMVVTVVGSAVLMLAGMLGVMLVVDWRLGLGAALFLAAVAVLITIQRNHAIDEAEDALSAKARLYGGIEERLTAAEDLRGNGAGAHAMQRFVDDATNNLNARLSEVTAYQRLWTTLNTAVAVGLGLSVIIGGWLVAIGSITAGTAFLLFQYVLLLRSPIADIIRQIELVQKASGALIRVDKLLAIEPTIVDNGTTSPPPGPLAVTFDGLGFHYGDGEPVLADIDLPIAAGRSVGVVGRTGSGKTTLSRLVLRLIEATEGELRLGGVPIADIPLAELRRRVALIPQEVQLIRGTIRDNVTLFDPAHSDDDVRAALAAVGLDIDPADRLGSDGIGLSAGESQLLALARVWLRRPDLVVLDEATARVDPATEADLQTAIANLLRGRTALIIAHRLSTLAHVDEIVVVDRGRVVEHGDRVDLEADPDGRYRRLLDLALSDSEGVS